LLQHAHSSPNPAAGKDADAYLFACFADLDGDSYPHLYLYTPAYEDTRITNSGTGPVRNTIQEE
jgi:hypothetical protein